MASPKASGVAQTPMTKKAKTSHPSDISQGAEGESSSSPQVARSMAKHDCNSLLMILRDPSSSLQAIKTALKDLLEKLSSDEKEKRKKEIVHLVCSGLFPVLFSVMNKSNFQSPFVELLNLVIQELDGHAEYQGLLRILPNYEIVETIFRVLKLDPVDQATKHLALTAIKTLAKSFPDEILFKLHEDQALVIPVLCSLLDASKDSDAAKVALFLIEWMIRHDDLQRSHYEIRSKFKEAGVSSIIARAYDDESSGLHSAAEKVLAALFGTNKRQKNELNPLQVAMDMKRRDAIIASLSEISTNTSANSIEVSNLARQWDDFFSNNIISKGIALDMLSAGAMSTLEKYTGKDWHTVEILSKMSLYLDACLLPEILDVTMPLATRGIKEHEGHHDCQLAGFRTYLNLFHRTPYNKAKVLASFKKVGGISVSVQALERWLSEASHCITIQGVIFDLISYTAKCHFAMNASWVTANALTHIFNASEYYYRNDEREGSEIQRKAKAAWNALSPTFGLFPLQDPHFMKKL